MYGTFRHSAWRYEGRDTYAVTGEEERITTFLRGDPLPRKTRDNAGSPPSRTSAPVRRRLAASASSDIPSPNTPASSSRPTPTTCGPARTSG
ncbi:DUF6879 family protein [Pseudonocardia kujensis]|uniref:DUF6879 family protein n=1 Tax=Pseudonocardia kujensis TaxID=1128675 RepID=UPI00355885D2